MRPLITALIAVLAVASFAGEDIVKNGDFKSGASGWSDLASDADREVAVTDIDGATVLQLKRIKAGAGAVAAQYNLKLKPQTLYKITITGKGDAKAAFSFRPKSSRDEKYSDLCKSWATSSCPLLPSKDFVTETLWFDSGLKADSGFLAIRLDGKDPGSYLVSHVSMTEERSAKPDKTETVILHLGDSITITSYLPFSQRTDAILTKMIAEKFPKLNVRNINAGVDGEALTDLMAERYKHAIKEQYEKIDIVFIRYGANDRKRYATDVFKKHLATLCDTLEKDYPGVKIILGPGPFLADAEKSQKAQMESFWQASREFAAERKYPLAEVFRRTESVNSAELTIGPGDIHPSAAGVKLAAAAEFEALEPLLKERP